MDVYDLSVTWPLADDYLFATHCDEAADLFLLLAKRTKATPENTRNKYCTDLKTMYIAY